MAFMVPVLQNDWDLYGSKKAGRQQQQKSCSAPQSRRPSQASGLSRQTSASSNTSSATAPGFSLQFSGSESRGPSGSCRKGSRGDAGHHGQRSVTFGPPSPPCAKSRPAEKHNFHTKVVDKLMRVVHRGEKDGARRS